MCGDVQLRQGLIGQIKKLDSQIVSNYFIGYSERSRGYKFYNPKSNSLFETGTTTFFEDIEFLGKNKVRDFVLEE